MGNTCLKSKIKEHGYEPTDRVYELINHLHSKTIPEAYVYSVPGTRARSLAPRRRIHKIMKGHTYTQKYQAALKYVPTVKIFLTQNPKLVLCGRIKLAKKISSKCKISFDTARFVITNLKRTGFIETLSKTTECVQVHTKETESGMQTRSGNFSSGVPRQQTLDRFFSVRN